MDSGFKRRKLDHSGQGLRYDGLIDFKSKDSARVPTTSAFVLQTDELLKEARLDYGKAFKGVGDQLHRLKAVIEAIEPHEPVPIAECAAQLEKKHRLVVPFPDPRPPRDAPYKLAYEKPAQCNVVGSYVSGTMIKSQARYGVDMVVQMPRSLFQDKDYMELRYFYRRAYYIAFIAAHLQQQLTHAYELRFELLNENPLLPVLALCPVAPSTVNEQDGKKVANRAECVIRVIPCAPEDLFPSSKLAPSCCSLKSGASGEKRSSGSSTPFYNATLRAEGTFIQYLRVLAHAKNECPAFPDACVLGKIWLQQRGMGGKMSQGGFGHFEWAAMIALLLQTGGRNGQAALSASLSSAELFKAAIQFLSATNFNHKPFTFGSAQVSLDEVRESGPVMFDPIRRLNLLEKMTPWSASQLQMHAKATSDLLADEAADKFWPTFIVKVDVPLQVYDGLFEIKSSKLAQSKVLDRRGPAWDFGLEACRTLKKAYGNRAQLVTFRPPERPSWLLHSSQPASGNCATVGVVFDSANMARRMDHGPPAEEQKEAARFRQFWGDKAELRRFKDGSILECVEWNRGRPAELCEEIARYILQRQLGIAKGEVSFFATDATSVLDLSPLDKDAFDASLRSFQAFERNVRDLEGLPLEVKQLSPVSAFARYASVRLPFPGFHEDSLEPMDVNVYFEASTRWPENLVAIQQAKIEFLLDLGTRLSAAHENIVTFLGRESSRVGIENLAYLDVVYDSGASFRLRIQCDLEETLLERQVNNKTLDHHVRQAAEVALTNLRWLFEVLPLHTQAVATFCTRLHPLSQTIRLVKRWFSSHKLSGHFSEELMELFVMRVFLQPHPWGQPASARTGLFRTLDFLSRWDWRDEPLIVDSAETLTPGDHLAARREVEAWRKADPGMNHHVLFVATSHSTSGRVYTRTHPSKLIASRMTRLARAAVRLVKDRGARLSVPELFRTSLHDYDVILHLSPKAVKAAVRDAASDFGATDNNKNKQKSGGSGGSRFQNLPGPMGLPSRAHPVDVLVDELQRVYEDALIFFRGSPDHDDEATAVVGAIWDPRLRRQKFRVGLTYNCARALVEGEEGGGGDGEGAGFVEINRKAVLLEIARIGGNMIRKIEEVDN